MLNTQWSRLFWCIIIAILLNSPSPVRPANIDPADNGSRYAYGENVGWINFKPTQGPGVTVTDSQVIGYAWGENIGWISLSPPAGGVLNDGNGKLSGFAWGENVGWINFAPFGSGVWINPNSGEFSGYAWGENVGWINFVPKGVPVETSWRGGSPVETISVPSTPRGPASTVLGVSCAYSTEGSSSSLGHQIQYLLDWGDGTYSEWAASTNASKAWLANGTYTVRAKARCAVHTSIESDWSEPLLVTATPVPLPDLTGQWTSLVQACRSTKSGLKCKISGKLSIQNVGTVNAPSSFVRFYRSDDEVYNEGADSFLKQVATGTIKVGKSKSKTLSYSFPLRETVTGDYIIAVIDADNTVEEADEGNNYIMFGPIP